MLLAPDSDYRSDNHWEYFHTTSENRQVVFIRAYPKLLESLEEMATCRVTGLQVAET